MSAVVSEADLPGSGAVWLQTGRYSDMTDWRQFGRLTDFSERNMKDVITVRSLNDGIAEDVEGFGYAYGLCPASATRTGSSLNTRHRQHRMRHSAEKFTRLNLAQRDVIGVPKIATWPG